jgi:hypothetical protein
MDPNTVNQIIAPNKEIISLLTLLALLAYIITRHIPYLLRREQENRDQLIEFFQKENARHQENQIELRKSLEEVKDTIREGFEHVKDAMMEMLRLRIPPHEPKEKIKGVA